MKVRWLVNENFPASSVAVLRASGYDVLSIAESHSGDDDTEVLALAREEGRWLVTFDRDYGELMFARNYAPPPAVILFRVPSYRPDEPRPGQTFVASGLGMIITAAVRHPHEEDFF